MADIRLRDPRELVALLARAGEQAVPAMMAALYQEAQIIMAKSVQVTPIRYGILRSTATVNPPQRAVEGGVEVTMGFGGPAAPYAIYVHENLTAKHDSPTTAKYLERPVKQAVDGLLNRIAERAEALMR